MDATDFIEYVKPLRSVSKQLIGTDDAQGQARLPSFEFLCLHVGNSHVGVEEGSQTPPIRAPG